MAMGRRRATVQGEVALALYRPGRVEEAAAINEELDVLTPSAFRVHALVLAGEKRSKEASKMLRRFTRSWPYISQMSWVVSELEKEVRQVLGQDD